MYDIIIVGAGPAGLTAALYALRANKKILVLEAKSYGGQIIKASKIENYPGIEKISGFDFATSLYNQVKSFGGEIKYETVLRIEEDKTVVTAQNKYSAKAVIIATGSFNRKLNIENEDNLIGKGVSYCATCDGNFFKDRTVAVIGYDEEAINDVLYLTDIAKKVYLISTKDIEFGNKEICSDVEVIKCNSINKLIGENKLESIEINVDNEIKIINIDGLFISVGREPKNNIFKNIVDIDGNGYIISEDGVHTKTPGVYVAGDTRVKELRQLTTAVADGSIAATIAIKELN